MKEAWKPIPGWEGLYEVSNFGDVKRLTFTHEHPKLKSRTYPEKLLKPRQSKTGYMRVSLCKNSKSKDHYVHALVLEAFVGPRPEGKQVRHRNGKRHDNRLQNLVWGTPIEQGADMRQHGTTGKKLSAQQIPDIREKCRTGHYTYSEVAREYGVTPRVISGIHRGQFWGHID